jgi:hypothetical protein
VSRVEGQSGEAGPKPLQGVEGGRPAIPAAIEGATPDEQTAFLAHWYPIVRDRIPQRTADPVRREALLALAERMNPAAWTDADQIAAGLQQAGEALERLSHVFAQRRRRSRRAKGAARSGPRDAPGAPQPYAGEGGPTLESGDGGPDTPSTDE